MLKVNRRIEKLEQARGLSDRTPPIVHHINFVDSDGGLEHLERKDAMPATPVTLHGAARRRGGRIQNGEEALTTYTRAPYPDLTFCLA